MVLLLVYLFLALGISFICSILEAVLLSMPMSFATLKEQEGEKLAPILKKYKQNIDRPISAILSLNTIAHTIGAAGVGAEATKIFGNVYFGVVSVILTILILVVSEIIPKTIGASYWRQLALIAVRVIRLLVCICYPLVLLSELITRIFSPKEKGIAVSREEVSAIVTMGEEEGVIQSKENKVIQNLIRLGNVKVKEVMTPRVVTEVASEEMTLRDFYQEKAYRYYSRIPVYGKDKDDITGYVLRRTVLENLTEDKFDMKLKDIRRSIPYFSENKPVSTVWEKLLEHKEQIALIVDEYGCFCGIATMEDIVETIFGLEIIDETDSVVDMQQYARDRWFARQQRYNEM
ncbi:MAG: CNNM domain-containing protein [Porphyromonadaceae bacterium]|nr:CNNM domain-containing protein [Porphyromonadaceae bacterium]